jgi:hypothetical protein
MRRAYYESSVPAFLSANETRILGELTLHHQFVLEDLQKNAWREQIRLLKSHLSGLDRGSILFEYTIPRMGKRVDVVLLLQGLVFVIEFKVGETEYTFAASDQALDYSLDLKNFHEQTHERMIFPVVVATNADERELKIDLSADSVCSPLYANQNNLRGIIDQICSDYEDTELRLEEWSQSIYKPTPTIIEAAQALYNGHSVTEISRSDSGAINLSRTSHAISDIIDASKRNNSKSICFVTGVPGSGKTLAGLDLANKRHSVDEGEHAVFLSGNGPLVKVLQEALARNEVSEKKGSEKEVSKKLALSHTRAFIQNIHPTLVATVYDWESNALRFTVFQEQTATDLSAAKDHCRVTINAMREIFWFDESGERTAKTSHLGHLFGQEGYTERDVPNGLEAELENITWLGASVSTKGSGRVFCDGRLTGSNIRMKEYPPSNP